MILQDNGDHEDKLQGNQFLVHNNTQQDIECKLKMKSSPIEVDIYHLSKETGISISY